MKSLYNLSIQFYYLGIQVAALFGNEKAKKWIAGRKHIFKTIATQLENQEPRIHNPQRIWIHVASLGEFEQARPLIEALKIPNSKFQIPDSEPTNLKSEIWNLKFEVTLTFFSPSGYTVRKNYPHADHIFYLPLDTAANARQFLDLIKPDLAIFVKYEFWLHYLTQLHRRQIPSFLISAIFRPKQFARLNPYAPILLKMLKQFHHIFLQDTPSVVLLQKHGFQNITQVGDTRIDRVCAIAAEARRFPNIEAFIGDSPVFIGGSTWQADEQIILSILSPEKNQGKPAQSAASELPLDNWKFIFAPHDISEKNISRLENSLPKDSAIRYSQLTTLNPIIPNTSYLIPHTSYLIIDNIGMLSALYRYAKIAYIGGGFGAGIHNTLEPIAFGLPVIFGPKYQKFAEAVQLIETGGGFTISNANDFQQVMKDLLSENNYASAAKAAATYVQNNQGATEKIKTYISKLTD